MQPILEYRKNYGMPAGGHDGCWVYTLLVETTAEGGLVLDVQVWPKEDRADVTCYDAISRGPWSRQDMTVAELGDWIDSLASGRRIRRLPIRDVRLAVAAETRRWPAPHISTYAHLYVA